MTSARRKTKRTSIREPQQARAVQTRERLLDVAGELLADVGIERISTNMISAHAGVTPPAFYRYFKNKYAVLEALGQRLMDRQNAILLAWLEKHKGGGADAYADHVEDLLRDTAKITASEPGGIWIERALRAVPQLAHMRIDSHRSVTDAMLEAYAPLLPDMDRDLLWRRIRLSVEYGYATDEMLNEEDLIPRDDILREAARLLRWSLRDPT